MLFKTTLPVAFWSKVYAAESGCWLWLGSKDKDGYGLVDYERHLRRVHRLVYVSSIGAIPEGLTLDHVKAWGCENKNCVNAFQHLEPVTNRVNVLRGSGPTQVNAHKTHCKSGHPFNAANTYHAPFNRRRCRTCQRIRTAEWRYRMAGQVAEGVLHDAPEGIPK